MLRKTLPFAALLLSLSTLLCCALPALFVALGAGATFVSLLGIFPQLIWFSEHKGWLFSLAALSLIGAGMLRSALPAQCPTDPALAAQCERATRFSKVIYLIAVVSLCVGAFFAFVAPHIFG
jgi:hypothetical protein